jgi:hypothetical protein
MPLYEVFPFLTHVVYYVYIRNDGKEADMKVTRRSDNGKSGHLLISVPASRVAEVDAALAFLEAQRQQRGSQVVIDLIVRAALRNGWRPPLREGESTTRV